MIASSTAVPQQHISREGLSHTHLLLAYGTSLRRLPMSMLLLPVCLQPWSSIKPLTSCGLEKLYPLACREWLRDAPSAEAAKAAASAQRDTLHVAVVACPGILCMRDKYVKRRDGELRIAHMTVRRFCLHTYAGNVARHAICAFCQAPAKVLQVLSMLHTSTNQEHWNATAIEYIASSLAAGTCHHADIS